MTMEPKAPASDHLTDTELFTLALPPAGEPEALPRHLSDCVTCSRAFSEWKGAVRELANEQAETLGKRSAEEWQALEDSTIEAIRRARIGRHPFSVRWALAIAAALALFALALPLWHQRERLAPGVATAQVAQLSPEDQADDALLRDVARLARAEDDAASLWGSLAPLPSSGDDDRL
jgi:hypothetical protein